MDVEVRAMFRGKSFLSRSSQHPRINGPVKLVAPAVHYNGKRMPVRMPPPWLGQHTDEVLVNELEFSSEEVADLRRKGDIGGVA